MVISSSGRGTYQLGISRPLSPFILLPGLLCHMFLPPLFPNRRVCRRQNHLLARAVVQPDYVEKAAHPGKEGVGNPPVNGIDLALRARHHEI